MPPEVDRPLSTSSLRSGTQIKLTIANVIGKMFGVLLVKNAQGELGFISAFSGKLAEQNHIQGFVPPVFDLLADDSFFLSEKVAINNLNEEIKALDGPFGNLHQPWRGRHAGEHPLAPTVHQARAAGGGHAPLVREDSRVQLRHAAPLLPRDEEIQVLGPRLHRPAHPARGSLLH